MSNCYRIKYPLVIAVVQWFITTILQVDRAFFTYDQETLYFVLTKILYLVFLILIWCFIFEVHEKVKQNDKDWKRGVSIFLPYFTILMIMLLILWPGTWAYDDLLTLTDISSYGMWCPWQKYIDWSVSRCVVANITFSRRNNIFAEHNHFSLRCVLSRKD